MKTSQAMAENQVSETAGDGFHAEDTTAQDTDVDTNTINTIPESAIVTDVEAERESDEDIAVVDDLEIPGDVEDGQNLSPDDASSSLKFDLPKHEKTSLMRMLTNFWAERSSSGWATLEYPLNTTDHIFADSDIIVREDEPSSLIALALSSEDYQKKLSSITGSTKASASQEEMKAPTQPTVIPGESAGVEDSLLCSDRKSVV